MNDILDEGEAAGGASPEMQAAVGRVVIHGAQVESLVGDLCQAIYANDKDQTPRDIWDTLAARRRTIAHNLVKKSGSYSSAAEYEILATLDQMQDLSSRRNALVHGVLEMNPDGTHLLTDRKTGDAQIISTQEVDSLSQDLHAAWDRLDSWVSQLEFFTWWDSLRPNSFDGD